MPDSRDLKQREEAHWAKTSRLMFTHLAVWFFFGFVIHMFVVPLNKFTIPSSTSRSASTWPRRARSLCSWSCCSSSRSSRTGSTANSALPRKIEGDGHGYQICRQLRLSQQPGAGLRHLHRRLSRLRHLARGARADGRSEQDPRLPVRVFHACRLRHHRRSVANGAGLRVLRGRPQRAGALQWHGDRRRLDVGGVLCRHGRHSVPARLRRPRVGARMDRRLRAGVDPDRAVPAQVRRLYRARLPGVQVRRQLCPRAGRDRAGGLLLHLCDGADLRHRVDRLALPRDAVRDWRYSPDLSASWSVRCWAGCGR